MSNQGYFGYPNLQGGGTGGAGTTFTYLTCANESSGLPNSQQLIPGTGIAFTYGTNSLVISTAASGGGGTAGNASKYILQQPDATLPNSQALSSLSTGLLKSTTSTGVVSIAISGTDYYPAGTAMPSGGGTGSSSPPTAGEILIGTSAGVYSPAFLTPTTGIQITSNSGSIIVGASGALGGTVQTVSAGSLSPIFSTTVTSSSTNPSISYSLTPQSSGSALIGPTSGSSAPPTYRNLVGSDLSNALAAGSGISLTQSGGAITIASTATSGGTVQSSTVGNLSPLFTATTANPTTTPSTSFSLVPQTSGLGYFSPATGAAGNPSFRAIQGSDIYGSLAGSSNVTLTNNITSVGISLVGVGSSNTQGTVTSFSDGGLPGLFTSSVATPTTTPAVTNSFVSQTQSTFLAAPSSGNGNPSFRAIGGSDISPIVVAGSNISVTQSNNTLVISSSSSGTGTVQSVSSGNANPFFTSSVSSPTTNPSISYTVGTAASGTFIAGPSSGSAGSPVYRTLTGNDIFGALQAGTGVTLTNTGSSVLLTSTASSGGSATVQSVAVGNLSPLFTASTSNATTTPSTTFSQVSQNQSTFFAAPSGSAGNPVFRNIGGSDIQSSIAAGSNVTVSLLNNQVVISSTASGGGGGSVTSFAAESASPFFSTSVANSTTTPSLSFTITSAPSAAVLAGPTSGASAAPTYRALIGSDIFGALSAGANVVLTNNASSVAISLIGVGSSNSNGTVTSVTAGGITGLFTTSVTTPNTTPSISNTLNTQTSGQVYASPNSSTGTPYFRNLIGSDLAGAITAGLNISFTTTGSSTTISSPGSGNVNTFTSGNLSPLFSTTVANPNTAPALSFSLSTAASATALMGPTSGGAAAPTYRAITTSDLPPMVLSVSNIDGTLTISPTSGAVFASIPTSVALPGSPTTTTQSAGDSSTKISTTAFVTTAVNNAIAGVNPAVAVQAATNTILPNSPTYSNGVSGVGATLTDGGTDVLVVDTYTPLLNDRILIKNQSSAFQNGIYTVTQLGVASVTPWILTRASDYNQSSDINNTGAIPVTNGTVNLDTSWVLTSKVNTVGTDSLTFTQFSLNPTTIITGAGNLSPLFTTSSSANIISFSQISKPQSTFFAAPSGGSGLPSFRSVGGSDLTSAIVAGSNVTIVNTNNQLVISSTASGGGSGTATPDYVSYTFFGGV